MAVQLGKITREHDLRTVLSYPVAGRAFGRAGGCVGHYNRTGRAGVVGWGVLLDILARDQDSGEAVVIENQIEQSDHEHLGKLITYASGKDAKYIVWIVKDAREEHRAAIEWLNKISDDTIGFFNPLFRRAILLENTNKPARRIFDGQFCGLVSISFWH